MANLVENVELNWCFLDPNNPQENFEKLQWSVTAYVDKKVAEKFKKNGFIRTLRPVEDADGNETGQYKVTFKQNAKTSAGKDLTPPGVFTRTEKGTIKPLTGVIVGNGSTGTISFDTYDWDYKGQKGRSMSLKNVLITNLIPYEKSDPAGSEFGDLESGAEFNKSKKEDVDLDFEEDGDY